MSETAIYNYIPHHRTRTKLEGGDSAPVRVAEHAGVLDLADLPPIWSFCR